MLCHVVQLVRAIRQLMLDLQVPTDMMRIIMEWPHDCLEKSWHECKELQQILQFQVSFDPAKARVPPRVGDPSRLWSVRTNDESVYQALRQLPHEVWAFGAASGI